MKKIVSFSGGRTSAYLCKIMIETFGRDNVDFIYMDTGAEHQKTYDFIRNVNREFGLDLVCLRGDFNQPLGEGVQYNVVDIDSLKPDLKPFKGMIEKYGVPYIGGMFCTDRMKLTPFKKYCNDVYGKKSYETWLGIRFDEPSRIWGDNKKKDLSAFKQLSLSGMSKYEMSDMYSAIYSGLASVDDFDISDLAKQLCSKRLLILANDRLFNMAAISDFDKQDVLNYWSKMPFDLDLDEWSGNCEFCPKKSNLKLAASQRDSPESYVNFVEMLHNGSVRVDNNTGSRVKMYRGKQSLESLIAKFDGSTGQEIKSRIRGSKMIDTNSCSESCEVFN
jgi:3'-phosphoadenosine 5'-phosphosulfate sulfotransferase (PAPS reductase)/FAD synthetase